MIKDAMLQTYDFNLPSELIATKPILPKRNAKLLVYKRDTNEIIHTYFSEFFTHLPKDCLIVLNNTKVIKARIYGTKTSGAKIELLYHKHINPTQTIVQIRGKVRVGDILHFNNNINAKVLELRDDTLRVVEFYKNTLIINQSELYAELESIGHIPLPPYIKRNDNNSDEVDYQSIFASKIGSIAAPTASLHFDSDDLEHISKLPHCFITLHIGAGTFFSVESEDIRNHKMHKEYFNIPQESKEKIQQTNKILCVGTTATRCVEYFARNGILNGECDLFLHPLNPPIKTDYLLTNFHLPKSSLIMLVASFIGVEKTMEIYKIAKEKQYRFYSYGDGMMII